MSVLCLGQVSPPLGGGGNPSGMRQRECMGALYNRSVQRIRRPQSINDTHPRLVDAWPTENHKQRRRLP